MQGGQKEEDVKGLRKWKGSLCGLQEFRVFLGGGEITLYDPPICGIRLHAVLECSAGTQPEPPRPFGEMRGMQAILELLLVEL